VDDYATLGAYDNADQPDEGYTERKLTKEERKARERWKKVQDAAEPIVRRLSDQAREQMSLRGPVEQRWLEDLRQFHGHYDKDTELELKNDDSRSRTFINITRPKTNAWAARLGDMLLPNDERNWGIDPTPIPELNSEAREIARMAEEAAQQAETAAEQHNAAVEQGGNVAATGAQVAQAASAAKEMLERAKQQQREIEEAQKRCKAMERLIDDQLTESRFPAKCRDAIADMCKLGVGIIKGPMVSGKQPQRWQVGPDGQAMLAPVSDDHVPSFRRVNPWHFFPDMNAAEIDDAEFTYERHLLNAKQLRKMARDMDFNKGATRRLLKEGGAQHGAENVSDLTYLSELRSLEHHGSESALSPLKDRFVVWEYHGQIEIHEIAKLLRAQGDEKDADDYLRNADPLDTRMVTVFFCNGKMLRINAEYLLDSGASLYSIASFEKAEASILGAVGVPRLMRHEQAMLNSAVRMVMDNAALSVSPQVVVDQKGIEPVNGSWKLTARKVWRKVTGSQSPSQSPPFELFNIPLNQNQLAQIIELAMRFVDEAVAMPLIAQGEQGAHITNTAQGLTMLMNSANVVFRRVVKNYDDDMIGLITRTYDFNMQFSSRPEVKGDMKVEARGTSVLLVREIQAQQLVAILREWSVHPIMGVGFRAYRAMKLVLQAMSINPDDLLVTEEDYMNKLAQMAQPQEGQESPDAIRAQTQLKIAEIEAANRDKDGQVQLEIAEIRRETEFAKLGLQENLTLEQIKAMFASKEMDAVVKVESQRIKAQSDERKLAAEIGMEREAAAEARARGEMPTGSGGAVSMGGRPAPAQP
jgi:hypothetical protein